MAFISFLGIVIPPENDPVAHSVALWFTFLWLVGLGLIVYSTARFATTRYYITTRRLIAEDAAIDLQDLAAVRIEQSSTARALDRGNIFFDSASGRWVLFKRVRHPEAVKQGALNAKSQLPVPTVPCEYCGKQVAKGTRKCPECGAKPWNTGPDFHRTKGEAVL